MKRILITGASGFIGRHLVEAALHRGYEVWVGVRPSSSLAHLPAAQISCIYLHYDDPDALTQQLKAHLTTVGAWDYVIHNAGLTKALVPADFFRVNAEYTRHLLDALTTSGCLPKKFVLMSSLSSYGPGDEQGFRPIGLDDPQRPNTSYGKSKLLAEEYVRQQSAFPYVILRPTGVYGPGDADYLLAIKSVRSGFDFAVGRTPQRLTFIYVKDLAEVAFLALEKESIRDRHYFVADGEVYTDTQFGRLMQTLLGRRRVLRLRLPLPILYLVCLSSEMIGRLRGVATTLNRDKYRIMKQRNWVCDSAPCMEELHFRPRYTLRAGLEETIREEII